MLKITVTLCVFFVVILNTRAAYVKRDVQSTTPNILDSFQKNLDMFRKCLDQSLAQSVNDVNVNQLQPVFSILGDQINRFSKAFEDLTAKSTTTPAPLW